MEKYLKLLDNAAEQLARKTEPGVAIAVDLEGIKKILNSAEHKINTANKAG